MSENTEIYQKVVSAKIINDYTVPDFTFDEIEPVDVVSATLEEVYDKLAEQIGEILENKEKVPKGTKFVLKGLGTTAFTGFDIVMSCEEEGTVQAVITAVTSTGLSIAVGAAITGAAAPAIAIIGTIFAKILISKGTDWVYDRIEESIEILRDESGRKFLVNAPFPDFQDIKTLAQLILGVYEDVKAVEDPEITINQTLPDDTNIIYTIKTGDTVWGICNTLGITYDELISLNPWLSNRFSNDMTYALIRPNEKLILPSYIDLENNKVKEMLDWYHQAQTVIQNYDPLLIDLNNDGIITTTTVDDGVINSFDERFNNIKVLRGYRECIKDNEMLRFGEVA